MNSKIEEFAIQSGFILSKDKSVKGDSIIDWSSNYDNELETFAKLLIKECLDLVYDEVQYITDYTRATDMCWRIQEQLKIDNTNK